MSEIQRSENVRAVVEGGSSLREWLSVGLLAVGGVGFLAGWLLVFGWVDASPSASGVGAYQLLALVPVALGAGLAGLGVGSRLGYLAATPSKTAGLVAGLAFGCLWAVAGGALASHVLGGGGGIGAVGVGTVGWVPAALLFGLGGFAATTVPREDVGSTLPAGVLLLAVGGVVLTGVLDPTGVWTPEWSSAEFPGSELVPMLVIVASLLGSWSAAKAKEGFGPQGRQHGAFYLVGASVFGMLAVLGLLIGFIVVNGVGAALTGAGVRIDELALPFGATVPWLFPELPFVTNVTGGLFVEIPGVMPAIVGTLWLVFGAVVTAVPLGVGAAVFLTEYAEQGRFTQLVEVATNGLWSTPSIVFGLFGLAFLVPRISGGNSIVVGQIVLAFMLLPLVLITSREAIKAVPTEYRDASAALGVTKWQTIRSVVLPAAMPGVITGVILGVGRIAGETAPLLLVFGGAPYPDSTPDVLGSFEFTAAPPFVTNEALLSPASALPYQLYSSITAGVFPKEAFTNTEFGWGTAFVLLLVVLGLYGIGIASRLYFQRKLYHE